MFCAPPFSSSTGPEAIDLARMAGLDLDEWQQRHLTAALGERDGRWAALEVAAVVPRQNGKNGELEARQLTGLFLLEEALQIHSAHMADTSVEQLLRLEALIDGTPEFSRRVKRITRGKGDECIQLHRDRKTGRAPRLRFRTRTGGGGRGFSCDTLYLDEAMILPEAFHGALMPVLSARPNPQLWYTGSAVDQEIHEHGLVLARVRVRGLAGGDGSLVYLEYSLPYDEPDDVPPEVATNPEQWALVNPALGYRITAEYVANEQRSMSARTFAVERLGVGSWPDPSEGAGSVITGEMWASVACRDESHRIVGEKTFGLDVSPVRAWGAIGVAGPHPGDRWHVAIVKHQRRTDWIIPACKALQEEHPDSSFAYDTGGPVGKSNIPEELRNAGVRLIEADTTDYAQACAGFYDAVDNGTLRYPVGEGALTEAVADVRTQPMGDGWKWSRRNSTSADITPLVAGSLALWAAQTQVGGYATVLYPDPPEQEADGDSTPVPQRVIEAEDTYDCFACRTGSCDVHGIGG